MIEKTKKIYIAGWYNNKLLISVFKEFLQQNISNIEISSTWCDSKNRNLQKRAELDYREISEADIVIGVAPAKSGTASEMGYALGKGIPVIYFVDKIFYKEIYDIEMAEFLPSGLLRPNFDSQEYNNKTIHHVNGFVINTTKELIDCLKIYCESSMKDNYCHINKAVDESW